MTKPKVKITDYTLKVANMIKFELDITKSSSNTYYLFTKKNGEWLRYTLEKESIEVLGFSKMTAEDIKDFINTAMRRKDLYKISYMVTVRKPNTYRNWFCIYGKSGKRQKVTY